MFKIELVKRSSAGARVMKIVWGEKTILTLQRAVTSTEMNYNSSLRSAKIPVPNYNETDFFEYRKFYDLIKLRGLYQGDSKLFATHKKELRPRALNNNGKIRIFRPIINFDAKLNIKDVMALIDLASHAGFEIITIPDSFYLPTEEYASLMLKAVEYSKEMAKLGFELVEIMPTINVMNRIGYFKEKLDFTKTAGFNFINIENGYYPTYYAHYSALRDFSRKANNICIYGSNTPRIHRADWRTAGVHLYAAFGQDIISQGIQAPFISKEGKESVHDDPKSKIKFFIPSQDALIKRSEYNQLYGEKMIYASAYCHGETLTSFINKYNNQMIAKIMKIVEFAESAKTLMQERDAILGGNYAELMEKKGTIGKLIKNLSQKVLV